MSPAVTQAMWLLGGAVWLTAFGLLTHNRIQLRRLRARIHFRHQCRREMWLTPYVVATPHRMRHAGEGVN